MLFFFFSQRLWGPEARSSPASSAERKRSLMGGTLKMWPPQSNGHVRRTGLRQEGAVVLLLAGSHRLRWEAVFWRGISAELPDSECHLFWWQQHQFYSISALALGFPSEHDRLVAERPIHLVEGFRISINRDKICFSVTNGFYCLCQASAAKCQTGNLPPAVHMYKASALVELLYFYGHAYRRL